MGDSRLSLNGINLGDFRPFFRTGSGALRDRNPPPEGRGMASRAGPRAGASLLLLLLSSSLSSSFFELVPER